MLLNNEVSLVQEFQVLKWKNITESWKFQDLSFTRFKMSPNCLSEIVIPELLDIYFNVIPHFHIF